MNWFRRMMIGRHGIDPFGFALIGGSFICMFLRSFFRRGLFGGALSLVALALLAYCYYRAFSRNIGRRRMENERFLIWWQPIYGWLRGRKGAFEELQNYKHLKCPRCSQKIRIPRGRGKVSITCPGCGERFVRKV